MKDIAAAEQPAGQSKTLKCKHCDFTVRTDIRHDDWADSALTSAWNTLNEHVDNEHDTSFTDEWNESVKEREAMEGEDEKKERVLREERYMAEATANWKEKYPNWEEDYPNLRESAFFTDVIIEEDKAEKKRLMLTIPYVGHEKIHSSMMGTPTYMTMPYVVLKINDWGAKKSDPTYFKLSGGKLISLLHLFQQAYDELPRGVCQNTLAHNTTDEGGE
jgi:hypothetical protein